MHPFIYLMFCSYRPLRGWEIKLRHCCSGAAQCLAADINRRSVRDEKEDYCMRLACQIQQSDSQGCFCTFMSLRDDRLAWMTYCPTSQWKTRERESTILTLCPFYLISGKEWLRRVRDLSEPSWITQARLYDGNPLQKQRMQLIWSSFSFLRIRKPYCSDLCNTFSGYFDISRLSFTTHSEDSRMLMWSNAFITISRW